MCFLYLWRRIVCQGWSDIENMIAEHKGHANPRNQPRTFTIDAQFHTHYTASMVFHSSNNRLSHTPTPAKLIYWRTNAFWLGPRQYGGASSQGAYSARVDTDESADNPVQRWSISRTNRYISIHSRYRKSCCIWTSLLFCPINVWLIRARQEDDPCPYLTSCRSSSVPRQGQRFNG